MFGGLSLLTFAQAIAQGVPFITGIWIAEQLSEREFGAYRLLLVLLGYLAYSTLGLELRVMYKLPEAIGSNNSAEIENMPSVLHSFLILNRMAIMVIFLCLACADVQLNGQSFGTTWILASIIVALDGWNNLYEIILRSYQKFIALGIIRILAPLIYLLCLFVFLKLFKMGITGIFAAFIVSGIFKVYIGRRLSGQKLSFRWSRKDVCSYIKYGIPLKTNSFIWTLLTTLNLWIASFYFTSQETGFLGFAMMVTTAYTVSAGVLTEISSVRFITYLGRYSTAGSAEDRKRLIYNASIGWAGINLLLMLMILGIFFFVINFYIPKYHDSWRVLALLLSGYYAYGVVDTIGNLLIIDGRSLHLTKLFTGILMVQAMAVIVVCFIKPNLLIVCAVQAFCMTLLAVMIARQYLRPEGCGRHGAAYFRKLIAAVGFGIVIIVSFAFVVEWYFTVNSMMLLFSCALLLSAPLIIAGFKYFRFFWHGISQRNA